MLLMPIKTINTKLAGIDEKFLRPVEKDECPPEYRSLLENINRLIERIKTFVLYQKELFIGIAHELKTPLAVMKSKNDVTLIKERDNARYISALQAFLHYPDPARCTLPGTLQYKQVQNNHSRTHSINQDL